MSERALRWDLVAAILLGLLMGVILAGTAGDASDTHRRGYASDYVSSVEGRRDHDLLHVHYEIRGQLARIADATERQADIDTQRLELEVAARTGGAR